MADLEMLYVKNGEGNNPLFQIGTRNEDGSYNIMYTDYLKEHQAIAFLEKLKSQEEPVVEKAIEEMTEILGLAIATKQQTSFRGETTVMKFIGG